MISEIHTTGGNGRSSVYQLKIVLRGSESAIWRRLQVPANANLGWLHAVFQVAMGWTNSHLHHFFVGKVRYCDPSFEDDIGIDVDRNPDEAKVTLAEAVPNKTGFRFRYEYDFGDSWDHEITVEKPLPCSVRVRHIAVCLDGARACPPEDCGGVPGYENLLKALSNRSHPEHQQMKEWIGGAWDAEAFDLADINVWLRKLGWPRVTETKLRKVLMGRDNRRE